MEREGKLFISLSFPILFSPWENTHFSMGKNGVGPPSFAFESSIEGYSRYKFYSFYFCILRNVLDSKERIRGASFTKPNLNHFETDTPEDMESDMMQAQKNSQMLKDIVIPLETVYLDLF